MEHALERNVIKIEANPLLSTSKNLQNRIRVAAYCRVSTDDEEQINSYEAQIAYYTETIAKNPNWIFAGVYADEGISGTGTDRRKNFLRLMSDCEKGKIDMILTKSISRFARNTVDSLNWTRRLRSMNIGVYFEEQALDSLKAENEMLIGLFSVIAQAESENISANVRWGVQQRMKNGVYRSNFSCFGYRKGENGTPEIVPEQADIIKMIYDSYLDGDSVGQIQNKLLCKGVPSPHGKTMWARDAISKILRNEKYIGDLLLQKTYRTDCISKKVKMNRGELPKYLVSDNHPAIISRDKYNRVQMEIARRGNERKKSSRGITEQGKYSGRHVLSEILICGECGSHYRRRQKTNNGKKQYVWRCINRMENGQKSCEGIGAEEQKLQAAILRCLNKLFCKQDETIRLIENNLRYALIGEKNGLEVFLLQKQIISLEEDSENLMTMMNTTGGETGKYMSAIEDNFKRIKALRRQIETEKCRMDTDAGTQAELKQIIEMIRTDFISFERFDDVIVRRLVECIRVMKDKRIILVLKGGLQVEEYL